MENSQQFHSTTNSPKWQQCELPTRFMTPNREFVDMMRRNLALSLHDAWFFFTFCCVSRSEVFAKNVSAC
jgi:hypothetical protein